MDSEKGEADGPEDLPAKIKRVTEQLAQVCLLEVAKKYGLPVEQLNIFFPLFPQVPIKTDLYAVTIARDLHHVHISWKLKRKRIELLEKSVKGRDKYWRFFGFIKEKPFKIRSIRTFEELEDSADIVSTIADEVSFALQPDARYTASFVVAFDSRDQFMTEADATTMIQRPETPKVEDISALKRQLRELLEIQVTSTFEKTAPASISENIKREFLTGAQSYVDLKAKLVESGLDAAKIADFMDSYEERLNRHMQEFK